MTRPTITLLAAAAVAFVAIGVFAGTLSHGFVFDDFPLIVRNPVLRDARNLVPLFGLDGRIPAPRALRTALDMFDFQRGGGGARAFHETSVALHAVASLLVFAFARKIAPRGPAAAIAALAFAAHPVHADAVAFVSGRKDVLSTALVLLSLLAFLRHRETRGVPSGIACVAFFVLALFAKEMAACVPLLFLAFDASLEDPRSRRRPGLRGALRSRLPVHAAALSLALAAAVVAIFAHRISALVGGPDGYRPIGGSAAAHVFTAARVAARALSLLVLPIRLRGDYSFAVIEPSDGFGAAEAGSIALLAGLVAALVAARRRFPLASGLGAAAIVAYLPVSHVLPHHEMLSEHTLYLPSVFFCAGVGLALSRAAERTPAPGLAAKAGVALVVLVLAARTADRAADFRNTETWCRAILREAPHCSRALYNLGEVHRLASRREDAERAYLRAAEIGSRRPDADRTLASAWNQAGLVRFQSFQEKKKAAGPTALALRDLELAVERFTRAAEFAPREEGPRVNLAVALLERGDLAGAERVASEGVGARRRSYHLAYVAAYAKAHGGAGASESLASAAAAFALAETEPQRAESARLVVRALAAAGEPECVIVGLRALRREGADGAPAGAREKAAFLRDTRRAARERLVRGAPGAAPESESMERLRRLATETILARRDRRGADAARAEAEFGSVLLAPPRPASGP